MPAISIALDVSGCSNPRFMPAPPRVVGNAEQFIMQTDVEGERLLKRACSGQGYRRRRVIIEIHPVIV